MAAIVDHNGAESWAQLIRAMSIPALMNPATTSGSCAASDGNVTHDPSCSIRRHWAEEGIGVAFEERRTGVLRPISSAICLRTSNPLRNRVCTV